MALPYPAWRGIDNGLKINIAWHPKNRFPSYYIVVLWQYDAFPLSGPAFIHAPNREPLRGTAISAYGFSDNITHKNGVSCGGSCSLGGGLGRRMRLGAFMGIG